MLHQIPDIFIAHSFPQLQCFRTHLERFRLPQVTPGVQSPPEVLIDNLPHGLAGSADLGFELGNEIVIEGQGSSHIMMLIS